MKCLLLSAACLATIAASAAPSTWSGFRGDNASGVASSAKPPATFAPGQNQIWVVDVPDSPSSPCVWKDRIFLTTFANDRLEVRSYQRKDGKLLWARPATKKKLEEFHATEGSPAASTPVTDGKVVVSYFGSAGLVCHDFSGTELWQHPLSVAVTSGNFGSGTSPIIVGDRVILCRDLAKGSSILALHKRTGKVLWETLRPEAPTSYGSPILWKHGGMEEIVMAGALTMKGYDVKTGAERWVVRGLPSYTCTTPVVGDGLLFFAGWSPGKSDSPWPSWESTVEREDKNKDGHISLEEFSMGPAWFKAQDIDGNGKLEKADWDTIGGLMKRGENVLLAVKHGGHGDITDTHVAWKFTRGLPYVPSPLFYDRRVYLVRDGGMMSSFDAKTGKPFYSQERLNALGNYYASPVAADGKVFVASLDGVLSVVKAGGDKPEILSQVKFGERIAGTPALVDGVIYVRTASKLYAFGK